MPYKPTGTTQLALPTGLLQEMHRNGMNMVGRTLPGRSAGQGQHPTVCGDTCGGGWLPTRYVNTHFLRDPNHVSVTLRSLRQDDETNTDGRKRNKTTKDTKAARTMIRVAFVISGPWKDLAPPFNETNPTYACRNL